MVEIHSSEVTTAFIKDRLVRIRRPTGADDPPVLVLLHGLTGDENVMWIFENRIPDHFLVLSLRGFYPTPEGGYTWVRKSSDSLPQLRDFGPAIDELDELLDVLPQELPGQTKRVHLMGFSEGAALAYAMTLARPERTASTAALAGFLPPGAEAHRHLSLNGLPVFITHGRRDDTVPIDEAHRAAEFFRRLGAQVEYCESDAGHKVGLECSRAMARFYQRLG